MTQNISIKEKHFSKFVLNCCRKVPSIHFHVQNKFTIGSCHASIVSLRRHNDNNVVVVGFGFGDALEHRLSQRFNHTVVSSTTFQATMSFLSRRYDNSIVVLVDFSPSNIVFTVDFDDQHRCCHLLKAFSVDASSF